MENQPHSPEQPDLAFESSKFVGLVDTLVNFGHTEADRRIYYSEIGDTSIACIGAETATDDPEEVRVIVAFYNMDEKNEGIEGYEIRQGGGIFTRQTSMVDSVHKREPLSDAVKLQDLNRKLGQFIRQETTRPKRLIDMQDDP